MAGACQRATFSLVTTFLWLALNAVDVILYLFYLPLMCFREIMWNMARTDDPKKVVVVGSGFGGMDAVRALNKDGRLDVTQISRRDHFEYVPGCLRLVCDPDLFDEMTCEVPNGKNDFILGNVTSVERNSVQVETSSGIQSVPFDYLILAMGADYRAPITPHISDTTLAQRENTWRKAAEEVERANSVVVVGGGAVGSELAAEIIDYYPEKKVTILTNAKSLVPTFPDKSIQKSEQWMRDMGVELVFGERAVLKELTKTSVKTESGKTFNADIVYNSMGSKPQTSSVAKGSIASTLIGEKKELKVKKTLQVTGHDHIFAVGDIMQLPEGTWPEGNKCEIKQASYAQWHGRCAAKNVRRHLSGKELLEYPDDVVGADLSPLVAIVSLGRYSGSLVFNNFVMNGFFPAIVKWFIEWTIVAQMAGRPVGLFVWWVGDQVAYAMSRCCCKPRSASETRGARGLKAVEPDEESHPLNCLDAGSDSEE